MNKQILIVEDEFIVADDLQLTLERAGYLITGIAASVKEAREMVRSKKPGLVLLDIHLKGSLNGIEFAKELRDAGIGFVYLSANSNQQILEAAKATEPYGFLVKPYREKDLLVILEIAFYRQEHSVDAGLRKEMLLQKELSAVAGGGINAMDLFLKMARVLQPYIPFDFIAGKYRVPDNHIGFVGLSRVGFDEYQPIGYSEISVIAGKNVEAVTALFNEELTDARANYYNGGDFKSSLKDNPANLLLAQSFDLASGLMLPLLTATGNIFSLHLLRRIADGYEEKQLNMLSRLQQPLTAIVNSMRTAAISVSAKKEVMVAVKTDTRFDEIIGNSSSLLHVLDLVSMVAPVDTSVLILGESGTGKEKIADCIHRLSPRYQQPFIKINCATLPPTLIESELFGHEKGAFTGATERKTGKFELANNGTIFLDEIGEMPLGLQAKLLRVLQEKEIERIGGRHPIQLNVRIIAATNRHLEEEMAAGRFRLDLYYRLNVFPVNLPPLRERKEDIGRLATAFAEKFSQRFNKPFPGISDQMLTELKAYHWPGNIRELENIMEQSMILNQSNTKLQLLRPLVPMAVAGDTTLSESSSTLPLSSLEENERDHILKVLKTTNGRISGKGGAAEILDVPPTTLHSKMKKLGITKEQ